MRWKKINIFSVSEVHLINFLDRLYNQGLGYSALNIARSSISTFLELCSQEPLGKSALVCKFMKGVFNARPSLPRNVHTWDPKKVLDYLSKCVDQSLSFLTKKCVVLLALVSSQRISTLHCLSIPDIQFIDNGAVIKFPLLQKQSRPGYHKSHTLLKVYFQDLNLRLKSTYNPLKILEILS